jgi:hypothetical protein
LSLSDVFDFIHFPVEISEMETVRSRASRRAAFLVFGGCGSAHHALPDLISGSNCSVFELNSCTFPQNVKRDGQFDHPG